MTEDEDTLSRFTGEYTLVWKGTGKLTEDEIERLKRARIYWQREHE